MSAKGVFATVLALMAFFAFIVSIYLLFEPVDHPVRWVTMQELRNYTAIPRVEDLFYSRYYEQIILLDTNDEPHHCLSSHSDDGVTWVPIYGNPDQNWSAFEPKCIAENTNNGTLLVVHNKSGGEGQTHLGLRCAVLKKGDKYWSHVFDKDFAFPDVTDQFMFPHSMAWASNKWYLCGRMGNTNNVALFTSKDDGVTWKNVPLGEAQAATNTNTLHMFVNNKTIVITQRTDNEYVIRKSTDDGLTWIKELLTVGTDSMRTRYIHEKNQIVMVGYQGDFQDNVFPFVVSNDMGKTWLKLGEKAKKSDPASASRYIGWIDVTYVPSENVYLGLDDLGNVLKSKDLMDWRALESSIGVINYRSQGDEWGQYFNKIMYCPRQRKVVVISGKRLYITSGEINSHHLRTINPRPNQRLITAMQDAPIS